MKKFGHSARRITINEVSQDVALRGIITVFRSAGSAENWHGTRSSNGKGETKGASERARGRAARAPRKRVSAACAGVHSEIGLET